MTCFGVSFPQCLCVFQRTPETLLHLTTVSTEETARRLKLLCFSSTDEHNNYSWTKPNLLLKDAQRLSEDSEFSPQMHKLKLSSNTTTNIFTSFKAIKLNSQKSNT